MLLVFENVGAKEFQCDKTLQLGFFGLVDDTHPALAELGQDLVVANGGADHNTQIVALSDSCW